MHITAHIAIMLSSLSGDKARQLDMMLLMVQIRLLSVGQVVQHWHTILQEGF